ncbi:MAG TPA: hypothetical protein VIN39_02015 [Candidatus Dormibacteraeota bacterium]
MKKLLASAAASAMFALFALPVFADSASAPQCGPPTPGQTYTCTMHVSDLTMGPLPVTPITCPDGSTVPGGFLTTTVQNGVLHITINKAGDLWDTGTFEGSFTFVADTGTVYTGHFAEWFGDSINNKNMVSHATLNFVGSSTSGAQINLHLEFHVSVSASGQVEMFFKTHC